MAEPALAPSGAFALKLASDAEPPDEIKQRLYQALALLAAACIERDVTETAADLLAFVRLQPDVSEAARQAADDLFADLESRICPRVIYDARELAAGMDLPTMIEYARETLAQEPNLTLAPRPLHIA